jgi:hypothetical protein
MINEVRNTVLALLNKNNNGYLTPEEFNLLATQAQLEIFEEYFYDYNNWITKQNQRLSNSESADIVRGYIEVIDGFRLSDYQLTVGPVYYELPTNWYTIDEVFINKSLGAIGFENLQTADRVSPTTASRLLRSNLTTPTVDYPIYFMVEDSNNSQAGNTTGSGIRVYPREYSSGDKVEAYINYIRYPKDPNWTWLGIGATGDPIFNSAAVDYQDFELPESDSINLIMKILLYAGVVIREPEIIQFAKTEEAQTSQEES